MFTKILDKIATSTSNQVNLQTAPKQEKYPVLLTFNKLPSS